MARPKLLVHPRHSSSGLRHKITPKSAGWKYVGFESREINKGKRNALKTGLREICVVMLTGKARVTSKDFDSGIIGEREDVFSGLPWSVYVPPHHNVVIEAAEDCEVAICSSPAVGKFAAARHSARRSRDADARQGNQRALYPQHPVGDRARREPARRRSHHAVRPLVELSPAQARPRRTARRDAARGDLLSPPFAAAGLRPPAHLHRRPLDRRDSWRSATAMSCWCRAAIIPSAPRTAMTSTISM